MPRCHDGTTVQANFSGDALYQQHLNGPTHKKALAKEEARRLRDLQMGASRGAAEAALVRLSSISQHNGQSAASLYSTHDNSMHFQGRYLSPWKCSPRGGN